MTGLIEFDKNSIEQAISEIFDNYGYGKPAQNLLRSIGIISENAGYGAFLIGGFPRDIIIYLMKSNPKTARKFKSSQVFQSGSRFLDLDIAVEGDAEKLAYFIKENKDSKFKLNYLKIHKNFGTALIEFSVKNIPLKIDLASLRTEVYKKSGVLPEVNTEGATLKSDIFRRDFTVNTVAFSVNRKDFLAVKDYACGLSDILNKKIRVLHKLSFIDDPTRIFRAVRFEKRLGFKIEQKTLKLMESALNKNVMDNISGKRITAEIYLLLKEKNPEVYFERLEKLNILSGIYGKLKFDKKKKTVFKKISLYFNNPRKADKLSMAFKDIDINTFYIAEIFYGLSEGELNEAVKRLNLGTRIQKTLENIYSDAEKLNNLKRNELFKLKLKNTEIYDKLKVSGINGILFYLFRDSGKDERDLNFKKIILRYLNRIVFIKPFVNGNDIKSMGICEGLLCGKILNEIRLLKIDGKLKSKDDELKYIKKRYIKE
ncbi:MAG: tRNA nucleotidyltransferase/poly(A) polymerase family protein [bacterium]